MRKLMLFSIGFTATCVIAAYLFAGGWLLLGAALCLCAAIPLFIMKKRPCVIAAAILVGCIFGFLWNWGYRYFYMASAMTMDGIETQTTITASDYSYNTDRGIAVDGKVRIDGKNYKVKLYLYDPIELKPGDLISGQFHFRYTAQGALGDAIYHQGKGIYLLAYGNDDYTVSETDAARLVDLPARWRHSIGEQIDRIFAQDVAGFARALLIGDSSNMSYELSTAFSVSGISHIIAVSGLHVTILCAVVAELMMHRRYLSMILGIPILFLFAAIAGFTPSVVRACIMQGLFLIAMAFFWEYDAPTSLAFSALVILLVNPLSITAVGFQLSVACMIGIYAFSNPIHKYLLSRKWAAGAKGKRLRSKLLRLFITSISISFSVWIVTTPLCAIHFGMVSIVGILANLLTVWLVSFVFCGILFACVLAFVWLPLATVVAWLTAWPMRFVQVVATLLSGVPYAAVYTESLYIVIWLVACYLLLGLFFIFRYEHPGLLLTCMASSLVLACLAGVLSEWLVEQRVTVLDVGQGQCILLKYEGGYYLVDCGGSYDHEAADRAAEYLLSKGVLRLDGVILTHFDVDHAGGLPELLTRVPADTLYLPDIAPEDTIREELEQKYSDKIQWIRNDTKIDRSNIQLFCGNDAQSDNESGICVLFQPDNYDILILGDRSRSGELALMRQTELPRLELLIVGHHGSANATSYELLMQTEPQIAVISVGYNSFGHPDPRMLARLEEFNCRVYRTDQNGNLEFGGVSLWQSKQKASVNCRCSSRSFGKSSRSVCMFSLARKLFCFSIIWDN